MGRVMPLAEVKTDPTTRRKETKAAPLIAQTATLSRISTASGCADPICITARCRPFGICLHPRDMSGALYRGCDVLDLKDLGFVSQDRDGVVVQRCGTPFDTTRKGNGNQGHEYGTELSDEEKPP